MPAMKLAICCDATISPRLRPRVMPNAYSAPNAMQPISTLGWMSKRVQAKSPSPCSRRSEAITALPPIVVRQDLEQDDQADDEQNSQRHGREKDAAEHGMIELEVHVEHHDDDELRGRQNQQRRYQHGFELRDIEDR